MLTTPAEIEKQAPPTLAGIYQAARAATLDVIKPLEVEDLVVQTDAVVSPLKWHLGHISWLFERFVLVPHLPGYRIYDDGFERVFNSYYTSAGYIHPKTTRGSLSRPTVSDVLAYRTYVDEAIATLLDNDVANEVADLITLGINHEEQHRELMWYDVKHILWSNLLDVAYDKRQPDLHKAATSLQWHDVPSGIVGIGHQGQGFAYDNESPRNQVLLQPAVQIANRTITNGEYLQFIQEGGYNSPLNWLSDGEAAKHRESWLHPLYWREIDSQWQEYTLHGWHLLDLHAPVTHLSYFEADAYARWAGCRLPTEFEWEAFFAGKSEDEKAALGVGLVWEYTQSAYLPYPGYRFSNNGLGEYNGKFMSGQMVLRGGSIFTPPGHSRVTYRNFFDPASRWQAAGLRLARDTR